MSRTKLLVGVCLTLLTLATCTAGGTENDDAGPRATTTPTYADQGTGRKDPGRTAPAAPVAGAASGGTITVYLPGAPGPDTLDPTGAWSVTGNAIQQSLISRSLTQYARGADGQPVLVPDLAVDLGRHNADFTEWTFTIRDDATWEDGRTVTAEEVAFGICRSLDSDAFSAGPGTEYSETYFAGAEKYEGPYTGEDPGCDDWSGISVDGQDITISMSRPFPDMDYYGAVMAMGPAPLGDAAEPSTYRQEPEATGPYKVESWVYGEELVLVRNDAWDAGSDPGRHQYASRWVFKFNQDQAKVDAIMLADSSAGEAAVSTSLDANLYNLARLRLGDRLVQQPTQCLSSLAPDYTKITDIDVRKALAYAYPYEDAWIASGEVPDVSRVPASSVMPPGMAGQREFQVDGTQITYDPEKAKELLARAGFGDEPYPITMVYFELDPQAVAAQDQITKGFEASGFLVKAIPVQESPFSIWTDPDDEVNQTLNLRGASWCPAWPAGAAMLPPLLSQGAAYNTAQFDEPSIDKAMAALSTLPVGDQADAWGALDEKIMKTYFPVIPIAYVNRLFVFGDRVGNPSGDASMGMPNYKDLYVVP